MTGNHQDSNKSKGGNSFITHLQNDDSDSDANGHSSDNVSLIF